ncbi:MAG: hypothetical protein NZ931_01600 [Aigarchaeota archaeon]|nr:hypothetical protein [Aigarchaeota archaeon]
MKSKEVSLEISKIEKLSDRARRIFTNLLYTVGWGNIYYDKHDLESYDLDPSTIVLHLLTKDEATRVYNIGRTFSGLRDVLQVSSKTLAKYLKLCEKYGLLIGYRFGKSVRYFLTEAGEKFLYKLINYRGGEGHTFLLEPLVILSIFYPGTRFIKSIPPRLIIGKREVLLDILPKIDVERLPEGKIYNIFLRLLHGLGYEIFSLNELEGLGVEISWRLSRPIINLSNFLKLLEVKRRRGIAEKSIHRIMGLIIWAVLMSNNIGKFYRWIRDKEDLITSGINPLYPDKIYMIIRDRTTTYMIV